MSTLRSCGEMVAFRPRLKDPMSSSLLTAQNSTCLHPTAVYNRPRHRRLEAFTTDSKIIRLIIQRVTVFSMAATWQFFDSDCNAAELEIFPGWYTLYPFPWAPWKRDGRLPRWQNPICHCTLSLRCLWSNLVTLPSRPAAPCLAGSGAEPQQKSNLVHFILKIWQLASDLINEH